MLKEESKSELINLSSISFKSEVTKTVPKEIALKYCVVPIKEDRLNIWIAMKNTNDTELINYLKLLSKKHVVAYEADEEEIKECIENSYQKDFVENAVKDLRKKFIKNAGIENEDKERIKISENAPAAKIVEHILSEAIGKRASDIHIEPFSEKLVIRYRIDGVLFDYLNMPLHTFAPMITRLKIMCKMDISEKRIPQDGKFEYSLNEKIYDLRISSLPTVYGEKFVIRILYKSTLITNLSGINFTKQEEEKIKRMLKVNHGIILVTGPTGSGKSTTLYAMLNELNKRDKNITTIEDPVEYSMDGINQVNVNVKSGITFETGLRSILRQDPDIVMIGEIRDKDTASIAVRAAITGHLVISTLHTNDAVGALPRLIEMGVERYLLADCLVGVVAQRLIRKICKNCMMEYNPTEIEKKLLSLEEGSRLSTGVGCPCCNSSGYQGRLAVGEVLYIDSKLRKLILYESNTNVIRQLVSSTMRSIRENCRSIVLDGLTTYDEYMRLENDEFHY